MDTVIILPESELGHGFVPPRFLPPGKDEYYLRDETVTERKWRALTGDERDALIANGNSADDWNNVRVSGSFEPSRVANCAFFGLVRIGTIDTSILEHHDLRLPVGITNSRIVACDIGDHVAIHNVHYLAHYIVGSRVILANVDEMHTTNHAKFGNGIVKEGESEEVRVTLDLVNETGSRAVAPFDGMLSADAYLWSRYRDDARLQRRLLMITQERYDKRRGHYGVVGEQCVIKNTRIIKDVRIGPHAYVKGANKIKNVTINSSGEEPTQIGEGVELVNGIIGFGCRVFYGCKAVRFVMGNNSNLKYGARLIHSYLGDNSTVSCCELLNNLIFPAHEQHHNNSFLVAGLIMGQSNIAAGATIGSNHNSRANDNEIIAGRGFWPGLCTSLKHSSVFASFCLIAKGSFPAELDIPLPFALVANSTGGDRLQITPAFWWIHNMYALTRNSWKYARRDARIRREQHIEFNPLAPDSVEEIIWARDRLERWKGDTSDTAVPAREVVGRSIEKSDREALILHPTRGWEAYSQMLVSYASKELTGWLEARRRSGYAEMAEALSGTRVVAWTNLGGQLVPEAAVDRMRREIGEGSLDSWDDIHGRYDELWDAYPQEKARHAFAVFALLAGADVPGPDAWNDFLDRAVEVQRIVRDRVYESRKKDFDNPFRNATYRNSAEMVAATGTVDDNTFVKQVREETDRFESLVRALRLRGT